MATIHYDSELMRNQILQSLKARCETLRWQVFDKAKNDLLDGLRKIMADVSIEISEQQNVSRPGADVRIELVDRSA